VIAKHGVPETSRRQNFKLTHYRRAVVILDERPGRSHAEALKLTITGTLGVLLRTKVEGRIPRIEPLLEHPGRLGLRLSAKTHVAVLRQAGE
jgi:predicted nucleic acid-binding protein